MVLGIGWIPGILFGRLALWRIRRNPSLRGEGLARAGLITSYASLALTAGFFAYGLLIMAPPGGRQLSGKERAARTPTTIAAQLIDRVEIGNRESELAHGIRGRSSRSGSFMENKMWRDSAPGGSFSYVLKVDPAKPMSLYCTYWGNDAAPGRRFDVLIMAK
jgi:hypothetical protein